MWSPFHHSSDPNMATDWMHAVMTFLQLSGESPICPVSRRILAIAFLPSFIRMAWCTLSVSWEPSQIPSHRVASLPNGTVLAPTVTVAVGAALFLWNSAALVLPWSKATPFPAAHSIEAAAAAQSLAATATLSAPSAHQLMSSTKERPAGEIWYVLTILVLLSEVILSTVTLVRFLCTSDLWEHNSYVLVGFAINFALLVPVLVSSSWLNAK